MCSVAKGRLSRACSKLTSPVTTGLAPLPPTWRSILVPPFITLPSSRMLSLVLMPRSKVQSFSIGGNGEALGSFEGLLAWASGSGGRSFIICDSGRKFTSLNTRPRVSPTVPVTLALVGTPWQAMSASAAQRHALVAHHEEVTCLEHDIECWLLRSLRSQEPVMWCFAARRHRVQRLQLHRGAVAGDARFQVLDQRQIRITRGGWRRRHIELHHAAEVRLARGAIRLRAMLAAPLNSNSMGTSGFTNSSER